MQVHYDEGVAIYIGPENAAPETALRLLVKGRIGASFGEPLIEAKTAAELMTSRAVNKSRPPSSGLLPDEERAVIHANLDRHYVNLLDQRVPALGNVTPRRAAKTEKGRQKLVAWLKYLENGAARRHPVQRVGRVRFKLAKVVKQT